MTPVKPTYTEAQIIALHEIERQLGDAANLCSIETFGRVYRSNGPTFGTQGSIGGLTPPQALNHVRRLIDKQSTQSLRIVRKHDSRTIHVRLHDTRNLNADRYQLQFSVNS